MITSEKQKVRRLRDFRLRKVRYEIRTLLFLLFKKGKRDIYTRMGEVRRNNSISYGARSEELKVLNKKIENLILSFCKSPINCSLCSIRIEDLMQQDQMWVCYNHDQCNQRRLQKAQGVRDILREKGLVE